MAATIVVTGGRGFLGGAVERELVSRGHTVVPLGSADYDLTDPAAVNEMYRDLKPQTLVHCAAAVGGIGANVEQAGRFAYANTMMGANLLEGARAVGLGKLVVIGTICSYPADAPVPSPESVLFDGYPAEPTAAYGVAKRNLWTMGAAYRRQYDLNAIHLIPTNLYGPRDHFEPQRSHVIPALIRRFVEAREARLGQVEVWGDGTNTREFLFVDDAARGIADATERYDEVEPVNLGTGYEVAISQAAETLRRLTGFQGRLTWDPSKPGGARRRCLDVSRAETSFGFRARTSLDDGLEQTVRWYESNRGKG